MGGAGPDMTILGVRFVWTHVVFYQFGQNLFSGGVVRVTIHEQGRWEGLSSSI